MSGPVAILVPQHTAVIQSPSAITIRKPKVTLRVPETRAAVEQERRSREVFDCDEESHFYSQCLVKLGLRECRDEENIIEFGTGDGSPVIHAIETWSHFTGVVYGFEINTSAAILAKHNAAAHGVSDQYKVQNSCFFEGLQRLAPTMLVANPPYIAAPDDSIRMPALHGGIDGAVLTRNLMSLGLEKAMLLISSYSNPVETLQYARKQGYILRDFLVTSMPFGIYTSEPKVMYWIRKMKRENKAFFTSQTYLLAGILLEKPEAASQHADLTDELLSIMTALR